MKINYNNLNHLQKNILKFEYELKTAAIITFIQTGMFMYISNFNYINISFKFNEIITLLIIFILNLIGICINQKKYNLIYGMFLYVCLNCSCKQFIRFLFKTQQYQQKTILWDNFLFSIHIENDDVVIFNHVKDQYIFFCNEQNTEPISSIDYYINELLSQKKSVEESILQLTH